MNIFLVESLSFLLYCIVFFYAFCQLKRQQSLSPKIDLILLFAIIAHGLTAYLNIDGGEKQNLSLFNTFVMTTWLAMILVAWNLKRHQAYSLLLISLPVAAISILEVSLFKGDSPLALKGKSYDLLHIFTGIGAMSVLLLAALQAGLVLYLDFGLKQRPAVIHQWLGPLQEMERYLVQLLTIGFCLMSASLLLVFLMPTEIKQNQPLHKLVLTYCSWLVFAALIFGRYVRGWRGVYAAKWTIVGFLLLIIGYFGSKFVLEFILKR